MGLLIVEAGNFSGRNAAPDPRIAADAPSARRLFAEWPTANVVAGAEIADALPFPSAKEIRSGPGPTDKRKLDEYLSSIPRGRTPVGKTQQHNAQIDPHKD